MPARQKHARQSLSPALSEQYERRRSYHQHTSAYIEQGGAHAAGGGEEDALTVGDSNSKIKWLPIASPRNTTRHYISLISVNYCNKLHICFVFVILSLNLNFDRILQLIVVFRSRYFNQLILANTNTAKSEVSFPVIMVCSPYRWVLLSVV